MNERLLDRVRAREQYELHNWKQSQILEAVDEIHKICDELRADKVHLLAENTALKAELERLKRMMGDKHDR